MKAFLETLYQGKKLNAKDAEKLMFGIAKGQYEDAQIAALLSIYNMRTPSSQELIGFRKAMLSLANKVQFKETETLDIVGTGGDGKNTFNISTLACFVCAGAGIPVTKHGNYGVSAVSGSSNVLEQLGIRFTNDEKILQKQLTTANITFLHAPLFHPAMKTVAPIRKSLQVRTVFNLLGPLINPSQPKHQIIGVYHPTIGNLYQQVMATTTTNFSIVHAKDGYDEISLTGDAIIWKKSSKTLFQKYNRAIFKKHTSKSIYGGTTLKSNATIFTNILNNKATDAQNEVVLANAALAIALVKDCKYPIAVEMAKDSLESGKAKASLDNLIAICDEYIR